MNEVTPGTLPVGDTGELLDTTIVTHENGTEAHREGVFVGDPAEAAARAGVIPTPEVLGQYNLLTRSLASKRFEELFVDISDSLKIMNTHLAAITGLEIEKEDLDDY